MDTDKYIDILTRFEKFSDIGFRKDEGLIALGDKDKFNVLMQYLTDHDISFVDCVPSTGGRFCMSNDDDMYLVYTNNYDKYIKKYVPTYSHTLHWVNRDHFYRIRSDQLKRYDESLKKDELLREKLMKQ